MSRILLSRWRAALRQWADRPAPVLTFVLVTILFVLTPILVPTFVAVILLSGGLRRG